MFPPSYFIRLHQHSMGYMFFSLIDGITGVITRWFRLQFSSSPKKLVDPFYEYYQTLKNKYSLSFEKEVDYNTNIDPVFYLKDDFQEIMKEEMNYLERQWRTRILFETSPRGNIIMFYDVYKQGFSYYCDSTGIPYNILNAIAMKYVLTFYCRDFFVDNNVSQYFKKSEKILDCTQYDSPLIPLYFSQDKPNKKLMVAKSYSKTKQNNPVMSFGQLVGLKRQLTFYDRVRQVILTAKKLVNRVYSLFFEPKKVPLLKSRENAAEKEYNYNRFIRVGKVSDFHFLQFSPKVYVMNNFESELVDNLKSETTLQKQVMSYSDFKKANLSFPVK